MSRLGLCSKSSRSRASTSALLAALLLVSSCATTPPAGGGFPVAGWALQGQDLQARIDVRSLSLVTELGAAHPSWKPLLERVDTLWVGLRAPTTPGGRPQWSTLRAAAEGRFPAAETAWALFWNRPPAPWSVVQPAENVLLVQPSPLSTPVASVPTDTSSWGHEAVRLVWDHPGPALLGALASRLVALDRLTVELQAGETTLTGRVVLTLADARAAQAGVVLLRLFGGDLAAAWNQDLQWRAEGETLVGEPVVVSQRSLINLLASLATPEAP